MKRLAFCFSALAVLVLLAATAQAVTIDMVPVGNPGNANDTHGDGGVAHESRTAGFRVAGVPEPGSISLLVMGVFGFLTYTRRRRK